MISIEIDIWKNLSFSQLNEQRPIVTTYILEGEVKRPAVIICPGGGYGFTSPREAEPVALQFNAAGYHAFVLDYSVSPYRHPQPIYDLGRTMTVVGENCKEWNIDKDKTILCGFSAGGHLAASMGVLWNNFDFDGVDGINREFLKPSKLILSYPVITSGKYAHNGSFENLLGADSSDDFKDQLSLEKLVSEDTPETFIWHTVEDSAVPMENSLLFIEGLRKFNIPFELHIYPYGEHGLSLATPETSDSISQINPHVSGWFGQCLEWLKL